MNRKAFPETLIIPRRRMQAGLLLALLTLLVFTGCSSFEQHKFVFWGDAPFQHPETIQDHWSDYGPFLPDDRSKKMRRGKAGVLRFYKKNDYEHSVAVDGELVVYVFEGNDSGVELTEPEYKLIIDSEQLNRQRKYEKKNGFSYHIWLDLGEVDLPPEQISILTVFTEAKTREQVASGITYTQIGGEPTLETEPANDTQKALDEASNDPARLPIPEYSELTKDETAETLSETGKDQESNQILSVDLTDSAVTRIAAAGTNPEQSVSEQNSMERRLPVKTAYSPAEPSPTDPVIEPINQKKLTFEDMRSLGSPSYNGAQSYYSQGVIDQSGKPVQSAEPEKGSTEPNLMQANPQNGTAKVTFH